MSGKNPSSWLTGFGISDEKEDHTVWIDVKEKTVGGLMRAFIKLARENPEFKEFEIEIQQQGIPPGFEIDFEKKKVIIVM